MGVKMGMRHTVVLVAVDVEVAAPPTNEEAYRENDDHDRDGRLGCLLNAVRQEPVEQDDRQPEEKERRRMAESP